MKTEQSRNLYKLMQRFADVTNRFIMEGNIKRAGRCLLIADKLFCNGNLIIKNAVANVYVYSLSSVLDRRDEVSRKILEILPFSLRREYEIQVNSAGV